MATNDRVSQALADAEDAIEFNELRKALSTIGDVIYDAPTNPRVAAVLQTLLSRSPTLANEVRNMLEPLAAQLGPDLHAVLERARLGLLDGAGGETLIGEPYQQSYENGARSRGAYEPGGNGSYGGQSGFGGAAYVDGERETLSGAGFGAAGTGFGGAGGRFGAGDTGTGYGRRSDTPPPGPGPAPSDAQQLWDDAMALLREQKIGEMIQILKLIPPGDRHYLPAQAYLNTYRENDREMQQISVKLAELIVDHVGTLLNLKDRRSLEQVRDRMVAARRLISEYNTSHVDRPIDYSKQIAELEEPALKGLQAYAAWDRAEWGLHAGLPAEAMTAFHEFTRLEPTRAAMPESLDLRARIQDLAKSIEIAQRFQGLGVSVDLTTLGMTREDAEKASQILIACVSSARLQASQDAMQPPTDRGRVTAQHVSTIEEYRDLLRIGLQLLALKPLGEVLRQAVPTPDNVTTHYKEFRTLAQALRQLIWYHETSSRPSLQELSRGAASYVQNVLEGETNTLLAAASQPGVRDADFVALLDQAHALLQLAATLERGGQALGESPDPRDAQNQSIRSLANRIAQARRARSLHNLTVRVLQPIAVTAGVVVLLAALFIFTPVQDSASVAWDKAFPKPTATPVPPVPYPVFEPDPRTLQQPPTCWHDNGFNVCDDGDGAAFMTHRQRFEWFFGRPISPRLQDGIRPNVWFQYFEGGRLEFDSWDPRDPVKYGNLGDELLKRPEYAQIVTEAGARVPMGSRPGKFISGPNIHIAPEFVDLYDKHGAQLFGLPVLESTVETRDGQQWRVQWFQRTRMEAVVEQAPNPQRQVRFTAVGREYVPKFLNMQAR